MFTDRKDAAEKLAAALADYRNKGVLVLGIPRGGAEIAYYVARFLDADLSLIITRKLGYPNNPEAAFGAIAEDGSVYLLKGANQRIDGSDLQEIIKRETTEINRRINKLRKGKPLPKITGRTVNLVDDGIATGATTFAAIALCKKQDAEKIIIAAPISGHDVFHELQNLVDEVVILNKPFPFYAVGQGYYQFNDLTDRETLGFVERWEKERAKKTY